MRSPRRRSPAPGGGPDYEWAGSGQVTDHDTWRATVGLSREGLRQAREGLRQAREALIAGKPYMLGLAEEDLVELAIE